MFFPLYIISFILGGVGAWFIGAYGDNFGLMDKPNDRSSHSRPTPKGGGIGILASFVFASFSVGIPMGFLTPVAFLALFSFFNDKLDFSPKVRLTVQSMAAITFLVGTGEFRLTQTSELFLMIPLVVFIVGTTNCYNFMDGINGIASITGIVSFGLLAIYILLSKNSQSLAILSVCVTAACFGFLPFNMPEARVFMGDVGSIFLGFIFAGMVVQLSRSTLDFICVASFLFPF
ncbi:UDP-N-acetylmuramyl pentapeptide phosphotransferase, partial [Thermodesulfobacteriota bacterium]